MLESVTSAALSSALDGLSARQRAIANNIANVNTPGYTAERVSFEDALAFQERCYPDELIEMTRTDELWVKRKAPPSAEGLALA